MAQAHTIVTPDGVELAATSYTPDGDVTRAVIVSSGTGFPMAFYRHFAEFLRARGALVVTYDYRGIDGSATPELLGRADLPDWAEDLDAVVRWVAGRHPELPLHHVGHSVGGHLVAFSKESHRFAGHQFVAVGAGTMWQHFVSRWPLEIYFWWVLGALSLMLWGHLKAVAGWGGTPLPGPVFRTWRRWSHQTSYYRADVEAWRRDHPDARADRPITFWVFTDDGIATPRASRTIQACFPDAPIEVKTVAPEDYGLARIGHEGAFRRAEPLWEGLWEAMEGRA
jgi:predicted alpha/beta hydrolase